MLMLHNIWDIVIRQHKFKDPPILAFYTFASIAVSLRIPYIICFWLAYNPIFWNIEIVQQVAKLCVGMVQDWITFELALGIHYVNGNSFLSEAARAKLRLTSQVLFAILALALLAFSIATMVSAHEEENDGIAF